MKNMEGSPIRFMTINGVQQTREVMEVVTQLQDEITRLTTENTAYDVKMENDKAEIDRKSAALRVALDALKGAPDVDRVMETAITTISEALA